MWNLARSTCALLIASCAMAHGASAQEEEGESEASEFVRTGFYLGAGGTAAFPNNWDDDYNNDLNDGATAAANANAQANLEAIPAPGEIVPFNVTVDGADLEDPLLGVNGVFGYRLGAMLALEVEGEWLIDSNKSNLDVFAYDSLRQFSTGTHTAKVEKIWTVTGNVKVFTPFEIFAGRFQPFAKVGVGVQSSELKTRIATSGLTATNGPRTIVVPADFEGKGTKRSTDGALRVGGGIDVYATRNILAEVAATYVVPFSKVASIRTKYVSLQWRLVYRF